jgi:general secretion pathway protein D
MSHLTDGQKLIAQGQARERVGRNWSKQLREEPENKEMRTVLARVREEVLGKLLLEADNLRLCGGIWIRPSRAISASILNLYPFQ